MLQAIAGLGDSLCNEVLKYSQSTRSPTVISTEAPPLKSSHLLVHQCTSDYVYQERTFPYGHLIY